MTRRMTLLALALLAGACSEPPPGASAGRARTTQSTTAKEGGTATPRPAIPPIEGRIIL